MSSQKVYFTPKEIKRYSEQLKEFKEQVREEKRKVQERSLNISLESVVDKKIHE
jgi:hypothetical protein